MRLRLATVACAAALVARSPPDACACVQPLPVALDARGDARGAVFRGGSRASRAHQDVPRPLRRRDPRVFGDDVRPPPPVDRGAVHGPLGVARPRRCAARSTARSPRRGTAWKKLHFPGRGRDKEDKHASDASTTVSVSDILDDLERQLFLASPASAGVAHHESPLSALARAGHGVLDVFPSLGISGMFDTEPPKPLMRSAMDVRELDDAIEFVADVPGARDEDLQVEVLKKDPNAHRAFDVLVVRGERDSLVDDAVEDEDEKKKKPPAGGTFRVRERHFGAFENRYALPPSVDVDQIRAKTSKGVLTVHAPKRRNAGPDAVPEPPEPPKREVRRVAVAAE